jgi:hypothetical protein
MFYCACWGRTLPEQLFPGLMRRFAFQIGLAILSVLFVCLAIPCGVAAQNAQPPDPSAPVVAATAHDTDTPAQQTSADTSPAPAGTEPDSDDVLTLFPHSETSRYWISGQANIILQWHGRFPAAYSGTNSFKTAPENTTSKVYTLYLGYELTHTTEVFLDIESAGGHGLSNALGLAGFTNLDVVRNPSLGDVPYLARLMIRQIIPLSSERVTVERGGWNSAWENSPSRIFLIRIRMAPIAICNFSIGRWTTTARTTMPRTRVDTRMARFWNTTITGSARASA